MITTPSTSHDFIFPFEPDDVVTITDKLVRDYLSARHFAGDKIEITWDGGNDSGTVNFTINGEEVDIDWWNPHRMTLHDKIHKYIIECFYDILDYGSWAGDFNATGNAVLVVEEDFVGFRGTDYYSEDENQDTPCSIEIKVPAAAIPDNANSMTINMSGGYDGDEPEVTICFHEEGNYRHLELSETQAALVLELEEQFTNTAYAILSELQYSNTYDDYSFSIADPTQDQTFEVERLNFYRSKETSKEVELNFMEQ